MNPLSWHHTAVTLGSAPCNVDSPAVKRSGVDQDPGQECRWKCYATMSKLCCSWADAALLAAFDVLSTPFPLPLRVDYNRCYVERNRVLDTTDYRSL